MQKWIKDAGPGQFRGEGTWRKIEECGCSEEDWEWNKQTGYLPTHEGDEPPAD